MGRIGRTAEHDRRKKLIRLYADMMEGKYPWPDGKVRDAGFINKSELLRACGYSAKYNNAFEIFKRQEFLDAVDAELQVRKEARLSRQLPNDEQLLKMRKLVNCELLDRLETDPGSISSKDLVATRLALDKLIPKEPGEEIEKRRFPGVRIDQLIVSLDGMIPKDSIEAVKSTAGVPEVYEGHLDVP